MKKWNDPEDISPVILDTSPDPPDAQTIAAISYPDIAIIITDAIGAEIKGGRGTPHIIAVVTV